MATDIVVILHDFSGCFSRCAALVWFVAVIFVFCFCRTTSIDVGVDVGVDDCQI